MPVKIRSTYLDWQPQPYTVLKNREISEILHEKGYAKLPGLSATELDALRQIYKEEHNVKTDNGGMFYSLYSRDKAYRKRIHDHLKTVLQPIMDKLFVDYKNVINTFVVKLSGPESEFYVHQDTTAMDEFKHSPLSVWIPLQDITPNNGALTIVEKSQWFFSPYRGVSFPFPFNKIEPVVRKYLKPVYMKAGELLLFDARMIHNSMPNTSGADRLAVICGIFPQEAEFVTCYKEPGENTPIELYQHADDYLLNFDNFFYDCHVRPPSGELIGKVNAGFPEMDSDTFEHLCRINGVEVQESVDPSSGIACNMIAEPDGVNRFEVASVESDNTKSWFKKLFG